MENTGFNTGYPQGNLEKWSYIVTSYLPQTWTTLLKTVDPLIYAALVELLGCNTKFDKIKGDIVPVMDKMNQFSSFNVFLTYSVPDFAGASVDPNAVEKDQEYILQKCSSVPNVNWTNNSVNIDITKGLVQVAFNIPLAYSGGSDGSTN